MTCGAPPRRACQTLNPAKNRIVPNHSARRKLYKQKIGSTRAPMLLPKIGYGEWPDPLVEGDYYEDFWGGYWELRGGTWKPRTGEYTGLTAPPI